MSYLKLLFLWCIIIITLYGKTCALKDIENSESEEKNIKQLNVTNEEKVNENVKNSRTARILVHPRAPTFTLRRRQPIKIRSRSDHFPLRPQIRRVHNGLPNGQQPQNIRYGFESLKTSKYIPSSKGGQPQFFNNGKGAGNSYRQQLLGNHPNSVHVPALSQQYIHNFKASPTFNGQVVVHPVNSQQQQQQSSPQDNSYPKYIKPPQQQQPQSPAAIIPQQPVQQHQQQLQQQSPLNQYPDFKQFPIPDQDQMQKYNEQHEKYLQQQKYLTPRDPYYQQQQLQQLLPQQQLQSQPQFNYGVQQPPQYIAQQQQSNLQQQQQQAQPSIPIHEVFHNANNIQFPSTAQPPKMYSVYEENDMTELQNNNYQTASYEGLDREAQEYLKFMNTNEYFLPKRDPNYKQIDEEHDRRQQQQQQQQQLKLQQSPLQQYAQSFYQQQAQTPYQQPQQQSQQQSQQQLQQLQAYQQPEQHLQQHYLNSQYTDSTVAASSSYNQPIQASKLYFNYNQQPEQEEEENSSAPSPPSSTVVKSSYQTGYNQNQFIVNSQNNKVAKYKNHKPTQSTILISTQNPVVHTNKLYSQVRQSSQNNRTPEPLRFEFTERDAMVGGVSYTHAPQGQLRYKAVENTATTSKLPLVESSTPSSASGTTLSTTLKAQTYHHHHNHVVRPVVEEDDDDPEDGDDMQEAGTNLYGRQPVANKSNNSNNSNSNQQQSSTTEKPPSEQKDTEEYCERICAIVEDENEEIVCGSDGYMYTSEAQMECYASCLHIDVTIQGKGSCSAR